MINGHLISVIVGWLIRWVFYYDNSKKKVSKTGEVFTAKTFLKRNASMLVYTFAAAIALYYTMPDLFIKLKCEPCNNEFTFLAIGYSNFETIKLCYTTAKKIVTNEADKMEY